MLGRVVATMRFVLYGTVPIGAFAGGVLGQLMDVRDALWVLAAGATTPLLVLVTSPLRRLRDLPDRPPDQFEPAADASLPAGDRPVPQTG
jgi:hypothetical protein